MVFNIGELHGGLNLYNNGLASGFVAAIIVPVIESLQVTNTKNNLKDSSKRHPISLGIKRGCIKMINLIILITPSFLTVE